MTVSEKLFTRNFIGLFFAQFLGAMNDNLFKVAMITIWAVSSHDLPLRPEILALTANAIFIAPFFLFVKPSGFLSDYHNRTHLIQAIKLAECFIMALAAILFLYGQGVFTTYALLFVLFLMGTQSTLFGPVKYAILPSITRGGSLLRANAIIEGSTFIAILVGMLVGAYFVEINRIEIVTILLLVIASFGFGSALLISPKNMRPKRDEAVQNVPFTVFLKSFLSDKQRAGIIYSLAWFWSIGSLLVVQLPVIAQNVSSYPGVITLFLAILVIGIAVGNGFIAYFSTKFSLKSLLSLSLTCYILMTALLFDFAWSMESLMQNDLGDITNLLQNFESVHFLLVIFLLGVLSGIFSVPLYTNLLNICNDNERGRSFAINNFCNAVLMVATSLLAIGLLSFLQLNEMFTIFAFLHLLGIPALMLAKGDDLSRVTLRLLFRIFYRVKVMGLEHYPRKQEGLLIVCNHISYLDAPLLFAFLPKKPVFVIDKTIMGLWWVRIWLVGCKVFPVDTESPFALKTVIKALQQGEHVVVFPEGALSHTGRLGKIYAGAGIAAYHTNKPILGSQISGLEFTRFGRMEMGPKRFFCKVTLTLTPQQQLDIPTELSGRKKRQFILDEIALLMREVAFQTSPYKGNIYDRLIKTASIFGHKRGVVDDLQPGTMNYGKLLLGSQILGNKFKPLAPIFGSVGIFLPNSKAVVTTFFALQAIDRVAVMLNFTAGLANIRSAIHTSTITSLVTSRLFIEKANLEEVIQGLESDIDIIYLEDVRDSLSLLDKLSALFRVKVGFIPKVMGQGKDIAVILFTSGSEGPPKGVALSHQNILSNIDQALSTADFAASDRIFNPLPMFHCFGLTAGTLLPVLSGGACFQFPTPLKHRQIAELIYHWRATVLFGANSFLQKYGEVASAQDFQSLRYVFAGAEKLKDETYNHWLEKFGIQIFQGYGVTESSPIITVNTRPYNRQGTVGMPVAGIELRLTPVPEFPDPNIGVLQVRGVNIMEGYIKEDRPGVVQPLPDGWHDTGDIVAIDSDMYISILGRQKRFAKISGEMISLTTVEDIASHLWPEHAHAALYREHNKRGEEIILYSDNPNCSREEFRKYIRKLNKSLLLVPTQICHVHEIPLLGTGKIDYVTMNKNWL